MRSRRSNQLKFWLEKTLLMFDCYLAFHNYSWNVSIKKFNLLMDQKLLDIMKKFWIHGCCYFFHCFSSHLRLMIQKDCQRPYLLLYFVNLYLYRHWGCYMTVAIIIIPLMLELTTLNHRTFYMKVLLWLTCFTLDNH